MNIDYFTIDYNIIGQVGIFRKGDMQTFIDVDHT